MFQKPELKIKHANNGQTKTAGVHAFKRSSWLTAASVNQYFAVRSMTAAPHRNMSKSRSVRVRSRNLFSNTISAKLACKLARRRW
jgi:hypothetical protein